MHIDKYKKDDGYYDDDNTFCQVRLFGFCSCGLPRKNLEYIRDGLAHIDVKYNRYWCDAQGLTEHGGCVPGWLSKKGEKVLADLREVLINA